MGYGLRGHAPPEIFEKMFKVYFNQISKQKQFQNIGVHSIITKKAASFLGEGGVSIAIWCILKCILIKFQGKYSLKISVFIATTKKAASLLEEGVGMGAFFIILFLSQRYALSGENRDLFRGVLGHAPPENLEKMVQFGSF